MAKSVVVAGSAGTLAGRGGKWYVLVAAPAEHPLPRRLAATARCLQRLPQTTEVKANAETGTLFRYLVGKLAATTGQTTATPAGKGASAPGNGNT